MFPFPVSVSFQFLYDLPVQLLVPHSCLLPPGYMEKQEMEMKWKLETETGNGNRGGNTTS